ncbi:hypothetical protein BU24DRAFT_455695 [Aaosphaeria arxii CBS 175.79]|uniref:Uncharacterized protein n=1 Tax=Aaosphaeria arxii CBS 175.79 TaxID=1450172 RepID=A0A6A5X8B6_9PLEO|nr:uncharacterized protein BU24DRAFT_455695 [Aaosphaeria arxii CBS 175.79]KAF2009139.1 hypothetical protein BU24DRAFT_455695 [Aaosphaeria arxii CBS 175.79]
MRRISVTVLPLLVLPGVLSATLRNATSNNQVPPVFNDTTSLSIKGSFHADSSLEYSADVELNITKRAYPREGQRRCRPWYPIEIERFTIEGGWNVDQACPDEYWCYATETTIRCRRLEWKTRCSMFDPTWIEFNTGDKWLDWNRCRNGERCYMLNGVGSCKLSGGKFKVHTNRWSARDTLDKTTKEDWDHSEADNVENSNTTAIDIRDKTFD